MACSACPFKTDLLALLQEGWDDEWKRPRLTPLLEAAGVHSSDANEPGFPAGALEKKSRDTLIQLALLSLLSINGDAIAALLEHKKAKVQDVVKKAQAEAKKAWDEQHRQAA